MGGSSPIPKPLRKVVGGEAPKAAVQPKVASQVNAPKPVQNVSEVVSKNEAELEKKRKGRKSTILTSALGTNDTLDTLKKTLLGG